MAVEGDSHAVKPKRVLVSYSHDSEEHRTRIRRLADQLRADGIDELVPLELIGIWLGLGE